MDERTIVDLLAGMESRISTSIGEVKATLAQTATKADVEAVRTEMRKGLADHDRVIGQHGVEIADLRSAQSTGAVTVSHKRRSWAITGAVVGICAAIASSIGTIVIAAHSH